MSPRDVFISHSSGDGEIARELRAVLESAGYSCWMAPDDIVGTETWTEQILAAITDSRAMVVLVSSGANKSPHVSREVNLALGRSRAVLPIRIENVSPEGSLEYLLSLVQRVDAFPPPIANHRDRILRRLGAVMGRPPSDPGPGVRTDTTPVATPGAPTGAGAAAPAGATGAATDAETAPHEVPEGTGPAADAEPKRKARTAARKPAAGRASAGDDAAHDKVAAAPATPMAPAAPSAPKRTAGDVGPGAVVGAFTIESQLGEGGMATVYRARQDEPRRNVALKVIRADHAANETYRVRFLAEKETLAALEHPVIVPIYAAGQADGVLYIAMRLVDGPDLQSRIASKGRLNLRETVQILEPIADAIDYAHRMGVIHRDLKPSNIILDRDGRPYLTDFGLGKRLEVDSQVSVPGLAIGTLDYMAPEQFTGPTEGDDAAAIDLYALGCVAFACLTGQPPFVRSSPQQLMYAHANEPPPSVRSIRPEYPPVVDEIFARMLAKDPKARFGSAREFVAALEAVVQTAAAGQTRPVAVPEPVSPAVRASRWMGANPVIAIGGAAVALVLVVVLAAGAAFGPRGSAQPTLGAIATPEPTRLETAPPPTDPPPTEPPPTATPATAPPVTAAPNGFPNGDEAILLALQPGFVDTSTCTRFENKYERATAMIACAGPNPATDRVVFFVLYPDAETAKLDYDGIMSQTEVATETTTGCFELVSSNHGWAYIDNGVAGPGEGWLGCYPRSETDFDGIQYAWTLDSLNVMGLWLASDYQAGLDYFNDWVIAVRPD